MRCESPVNRRPYQLLVKRHSQNEKRAPTQSGPFALGHWNMRDEKITEIGQEPGL